jgi:hypothetical protein
MATSGQVARLDERGPMGKLATPGRCRSAVSVPASAAGQNGFTAHFGGLAAARSCGIRSTPARPGKTSTESFNRAQRCSQSQFLKLLASH